MKITVKQPFPGSKKIYVQGSHSDIQVPMREISQGETLNTFEKKRIYLYRYMILVDLIQISMLKLIFRRGYVE